MEKLKSISVFIILIASIVALLVTGILIFIMNGYIKDVRKLALENSQVVAKQTFADMFQIMKTDWTKAQLEEFLKSVEKAHERSNTEVYIYRGQIVDDLFGKINQRRENNYVKYVFQTGRLLHHQTNKNVTYYYPLKARDICLRCHINAKVGDTLGVIEVRSNISKIINIAKIDALKGFVIAISTIIVGAFIAAFIIIKIISHNVKKLQKEVEKISSVDDLQKLNLTSIDFFFKELNDIRNNIANLIEKMVRISVDKDILEFEIKLLEKFVITSNAISEWQEFLKDILKDVAKLVDFMFFFTIFRVDEDRFESYIFWRCNYENYKHAVEDDIISSVKAQNIFPAGADVDFYHILLEDKAKMVDYEKIAKLSKSIILEKPLVGGAVGIGISFEVSESEIKRLAVEALLSTILNVVGSIKAISKYTKELEYYATRDPLTNLYNQRVFWELLGYEVERAKRHDYKFALLIMDLDNFKLVNDTYGHVVGDKFLRSLSEIFENNFRNEDIVARYGGDEFAVIMPYTDVEQASTAAYRLLNNIDNFFMEIDKNKIVKATVSIGIASYPDHGKTPKELFTIADNMVYKAKEEGKNTIKIPTHEDLKAAAEEFGKMNFLLMDAVEKRKIIPFFQPIVDINTLKPHAYEVLMRIEDDGEIIPAYKFIEVAEMLGLVYKLDHILMEKAIEKFAKHLKDQDENIKIFFNLSPKSLVIKDFIDNVKNIISDYNVPHKNVVFEITERDTIRNLDALKKFVQALKLEGFSFAIDDFGSGFASYAYIKHFPIDYVKIDGEIVRTMISNKVDDAFVKSTVTLSKMLNIKTIAEFVESEDVLNALKIANVDYAQGYHIGKPAKEFKSITQ